MKPTDLLDLETCVWLEEELKTYKTILVIVSHSQDVMNGVLHLDNRKLEVYGGNHDTFMKTRLEQIRRDNQEKREKEG